MPSWLRVSLICLAVILAVSFTAQMLMNAYLVRQQKAHEAEQKAIDDHYPLMYADSIRRISAEYNLSPSLIASVIMNESSFRPTVQSSVGARGLMQLMPDTAASLGVNPYDKQQNIEGGAKYLRQMLDSFGGDVKKAVAAYNAGPNAVKKYGGIPPYPETQSYVDKVLDLYQ